MKLDPIIQSEARQKEKHQYSIKLKLSHSVMSNSAILGTVAHQAPPSMGLSRQEYWSGLPFPSPGGLPDPGIEPGSPASQSNELPSEPPGKPIQYNILPQIYGI